jgi:hypothetical protein
LLLDEDGLGHHGTRTPGTGEPDDSPQQMEKQDGEIAHGPIVTSWPNPGNAKEIGIRHAQARRLHDASLDRTKRALFYAKRIKAPQRGVFIESRGIS